MVVLVLMVRESNSLESRISTRGGGCQDSRFTSKFPPTLAHFWTDSLSNTLTIIPPRRLPLPYAVLLQISIQSLKQSFNMASAKKTTKAESLARAKKWAVERRDSKSSASTVKASNTAKEVRPTVSKASASRKRNTRASATEFPTAKKTPSSTDRAEIRERARASVQRKSKKPQCDAEETTRPVATEEADRVPVVVVETNSVNVVEDSEGLEDFKTACAGTQAETGTVVNECDVEELNRLKQDVGNAFHRLEVFCEKMVTKTGGDAMDCD